LKKHDKCSTLRAMKRAPPPRGILRGHRYAGRLDGDRITPTGPLAPFVHHYYFVEWDLSEPFLGEALSHPSALIAFEDSTAMISGVQTGRTASRLVGKGRKFGIRFRPAMFQPLLHRPMSTLTDRSVPFASVFENESPRKILAARNVSDAIASAEALLNRYLVPPADDVLRIRDVVERAMHDRSLLRAEDLAVALDLDMRTTQRRFRHYVGVSPKWIIRRYRLHEAAEQLRGKSPPALAALAADLGYADQAHFAREFRQVIGRTPRMFQRGR
jgi:AraC-like DNA-binding protein